MNLSAGKSHGPFPLTPTLSLGERESNRPRAGLNGTLRWVESEAAMPPLPEGEGWGEGEGRSDCRKSTKLKSSGAGVRGTTCPLCTRLELKHACKGAGARQSVSLREQT